MPFGVAFSGIKDFFPYSPMLLPLLLLLFQPPFPLRGLSVDIADGVDVAADTVRSPRGISSRLDSKSMLAIICVVTGCP